MAYCHGEQSRSFMRFILNGVCVLHRRVHISQTTKDSLHGEFELEPGNGGERCEYLLEKGIDTYLVLVPKQVANGLSVNVSGFSAILVLFFSKTFPCFFQAMWKITHRPTVCFTQKNKENPCNIFPVFKKKCNFVKITFLYI